MPRIRYSLIYILSLFQFACALALPLQAADIAIPLGRIKSDKPRYILISIGVNQYQDKFWNQLKWAKSDAKMVVDTLGLDTEYPIVKQLILDEAATLKNIKQKLTELHHEIQSKDIVVLYLSTHGSLTLDQEGNFKKYVILNDSQHERLPTTALSHEFLRAWMDSLPATRKLLIFASCHSGLGKSRVPNEIAELLAQKKGSIDSLNEVSDSFLVFSAASERETASETDELRGDIYTHFFLEGLNSFDRNRDGVVTALEAHDYATEKAWVYTGGKQRASAEAKVIGKADLPLRGQGKRPGLPILEAYEPQLHGFSVLINKGSKGLLPSAFPLNPDGNVIKIYPPDSDQPSAIYSLDAKPGETLDIKDITAPEPFELRATIGQSTWLDKDFHILSTTSQSNTLNWSFYWRMKSWSIGLSHQPVIKLKGKPLPGLSSTFKYSQTLVLLAYSQALTANMQLKSSLGFGRQFIDVSLNDEYKASQSFSDQSPIKALNLELNYRIKANFALGAGLSYLSGSAELGRLGSLKTTQTVYELSIAWMFGGKARRIQ